MILWSFSLFSRQLNVSTLIIRISTFLRLVFLTGCWQCFYLSFQSGCVPPPVHYISFLSPQWLVRTHVRYHQSSSVCLFSTSIFWNALHFLPPKKVYCCIILYRNAIFYCVKSICLQLCASALSDHSVITLRKKLGKGVKVFHHFVNKETPKMSLWPRLVWKPFVQSQWSSCSLDWDCSDLGDNQHGSSCFLAPTEHPQMPDAPSMSCIEIKTNL